MPPVQPTAAGTVRRVTGELTQLTPGQPIIYGGNRVTYVPDELAASFAAGDRLVVVHETGDLLHVPQTWTKFGERLNIPTGRRPKVVKMVGPSQFWQIVGAARRHADFSAAQGIRPSSTPSQANPDEVPGAAWQSSAACLKRRPHLL